MQFIDNLQKELVKERGIAESSAAQYVRTLFSLNGKKTFKNLSWLKNTEAIKAELSKFAPSTQTGYINAMVSVLSLYADKPTYKKTYKYWKDIAMESKSNLKEPNTRSEKQEANWVEWKDVEAKVAELAKDVSSSLKSKHITPVQWDTLVYYVVLSLYTYVPPRRNQDYSQMYVVKKWEPDMDKSKNYYDLTTHQFVFNKYKTARAYGVQKVEVPEVLQNVLSTYIKRHPLNRPGTKEFRLLTHIDGTELNQVNGITRILNRIFGKKVGISMLRHSYLTGKYGSEMGEMKADAEAMGHSLSEQKDYVLPETK